MDIRNIENFEKDIYINPKYANIFMGKDNVAYYMDNVIEKGKKIFLLSNYKNFDKQIRLLKIFYNQPEMFIDTCHYSDKGADVLSNKVLEIILSTVNKIYAKK